MPNRRRKTVEKNIKSYPEPWIAQCEPWLSNTDSSNPKIPYTSQPLNQWPPEFSIPQEPWNQLPFQHFNQWQPAAINQMSSGHGVPLQHAPLNELPPEIWNEQPCIPLIQKPLVQANYTSGRNVIPFRQKITPPSHSLSRAPLLSAPSDKPFNSHLSKSNRSTNPYSDKVDGPSRLHTRLPLLSIPNDQPIDSHSLSRAPLLSTPSDKPFNSESGKSTSPHHHTVTGPSRLRSKAPLLSTPSQPYISNDRNATKGSTGRTSDILALRDPSSEFNSFKERERSPIYLNQRSSIDAKIQGTPQRRTSFRKIEFNKEGGLQIHVGSAENKEEEDVQYLYSLDNKKGKLVEFVDLSEDLKTSGGQNPSTSNEKGDLVERRRNRRKTCCNRCHKSYENLYNNKCNLYSAKCGHLFCALCITKLKSNNCMICEDGDSHFSKIVL